MSEVVGLSWDLTGGVADSGLGQTIIKLATRTGGNAPSGVYHVGLLVYGYVYEFSEFGMNTSEAGSGYDPGSAYIDGDLKRKDKLGLTRKTKREFDEWVENSKRTYNKNKYDIVSLNCINWATEACKFLGVNPPKVWKDVCDLAKENAGLTRTLHRTFQMFN